ncbi:Ribosomal 50S subunit-recycling heat shock protein, contains S4 domain [Thermoactinomyces sp. DSM 45891]|uniref:RNA-binding S4 domain-containing protein n=1 Tax=Thermoactinomyces sp. DSM 45891 TaxID=1761907 RepID=UPI0009249281|nr:RNA-binding S4 domain-containing protein [Thermoactinomyces sp. DSM 45891]SFX39876.1 Ribosomal 50S subunit-recycling heat shock protein, contains S4 domain [Thermoactinomyces sp. DSM 45891]
MRLDKFLKVSRLVKRRTLAKEVCDQGRVKVNGKVVKAGTVVAVGDEISIRFGQKVVTANVLRLLDHVRKEEADTMYEIAKEEQVTDSSRVDTEGEDEF